MMCPADYLYVDGCEKNDGEQLVRLMDFSGVQWASSLNYRSTCGKGAEIQNFFARITVCQMYYLQIGCVGNSACGGKLRIRINNTTMTSPVTSSTPNRIRGQNSLNNVINVENSIAKDDELIFDDDAIDTFEMENMLFDSSSFAGSTTTDRSSDKRNHQKRLLGESSSGLGSSGYCDYVHSLTIGAIVGITVVPLLCCCVCGLVGYRMYLHRKQSQINPVEIDSLPAHSDLSPRSNSNNYFYSFQPIPMVQAFFLGSSATHPPNPYPASLPMSGVHAADEVPTAYAYARPPSADDSNLHSFNRRSRRAYACLPTMTTSLASPTGSPRNSITSSFRAAAAAMLSTPTSSSSRITSQPSRRDELDLDSPVSLTITSPPRQSSRRPLRPAPSHSLVTNNLSPSSANASGLVNVVMTQQQEENAVNNRLAGAIPLFVATVEDEEL